MTISRATVRASSAPWSCSTRASARSMPAVTPADVHTSPSRIKMWAVSTSTDGYRHTPRRSGSPAQPSDEVLVGRGLTHAVTARHHQGVDGARDDRDRLGNDRQPGRGGRHSPRHRDDRRRVRRAGTEPIGHREHLERAHDIETQHTRKRHDDHGTRIEICRRPHFVMLTRDPPDQQGRRPDRFGHEAGRRGVRVAGSHSARYRHRLVPRLSVGRP